MVLEEVWTGSGAMGMDVAFQAIQAGIWWMAASLARGRAGLPQMAVSA